MLFKNYSLFMEGKGKSDYRVLHWVNAGGSILNIAPNLNHKDPVVRKLIENPTFRKALSHAIDRDAIHERYRIEREKRLRPDGPDQYIEPSGRFAHLADVIQGVDFINGINPSTQDQAAA